MRCRGSRGHFLRFGTLAGCGALRDSLGHFRDNLRSSQHDSVLGYCAGFSGGSKPCKRTSAKIRNRPLLAGVRVVVIQDAQCLLPAGGPSKALSGVRPFREIAVPWG